MEVEKNEKFYLENLNRMRELESEIVIPEILDEERVKSLIDLYEGEIQWILTLDKYSTKKRKELGYESRRGFSETIQKCKLVVMVLYQLLNTPSYLTKYSKDWSEHTYCRIMVESYEKQNTIKK